jgi:nitrite reductase (NADH) large subunit
VVIDDHCRTSDPHVYAIGECASWNEQTFGLVAPGYEMARVAARHIAGEASAAFAGADMSTKLKLMGVDVASIGDAHGKTPHCRSFSFTDELNGSTRRSSSARTAASCWAPCWWATRPSTAPCCRWP